MRITGWSLVRFVHVTAAMGWVGGQMLLSAVVLPTLRRHLPTELRGPVARATARRFATVANAVLLPTLLVTGVAWMGHRSVTAQVLTGTGYGRLLTAKLGLVVLSVGLAAGHGLLAATRPRVARPLAVAGLAASLGVVVCATALVR